MGLTTRLRRGMVSSTALAAILAMTVVPASADEKSITFPAHLNPQTNPCDGSPVPQQTGTTTLTVTDSETADGRPFAIITTDVDVGAGEYTSTIDTTAIFKGIRDHYDFKGDQFTYRNGVLEYVVFHWQETVFMDGDQPIGHALGGGLALCADQYPPSPPH